MYNYSIQHQLLDLFMRERHCTFRPFDGFFRGSILSRTAKHSSIRQALVISTSSCSKNECADFRGDSQQNYPARTFKCKLNKSPAHAKSAKTHYTNFDLVACPNIQHTQYIRDVHAATKSLPITKHKLSKNLDVLLAYAKLNNMAIIALRAHALKNADHRDHTKSCTQHER